MDDKQLWEEIQEIRRRLSAHSETLTDQQIDLAGLVVKVNLLWIAMLGLVGTIGAALVTTWLNSITQ